jgi:2-succinyl-5-enolpyruvyl-6-hydroxy-3-cyclohexene-1-carboxylate synthase
LADPTSPARLRGPQSNVVITAHDAFLRDPEQAKDLAPDLVIQLGGTPSSNALRALVGAAPDVIAIDPRGVWRDPEHSLKTLFEASPGPLAQLLQSQLPAREDAGWLERWQAIEARTAQTLNAHTEQGWWAGAIVRTVLETLPEGTLLNVASSMPIRDLDGFGRPQNRRIQATSNRGVNGIDGTLATTFGLAQAWQRGPTVALLGDLAFLHDQSSLMLARNFKRPVVALVADNSGGGIFCHLPIAENTDAFEPWFLTPQDADIPKLCAAHGIACQTLQSAKALSEALQGALERPGLTVLHLPFDGAEDLARHQAAWAAVSGS